MKNARMLLALFLFFLLGLVTVPLLADEDKKKDPTPPAPTPLPRSQPLDLNWETAPMGEAEEAPQSIPTPIPAPESKPETEPEPERKPERKPEAAPSDETKESSPEQAPEHAFELANDTYMVKRGDNLFRIARRFGSTVDDLAKANGLADPTLIHPGEVLTIVKAKAGSYSAPALAPSPPSETPPAPSPEASPPEPAPAGGGEGKTHTVRRGDTLYQLARRFGVPLAAMVEVNELANPRLLNIGQVLLIPDGDYVVQNPDAAKEAVSPPSPPSPPPPPPVAEFVWPTDSQKVIQYYRAGHPAIDLPFPVGTEIRAVAAGTVEFAGWNNAGYGNLVVVDHGNGLRTLYAHNSEFMVSKGDTVAQGEPIALSGNTGYSTTPHLHLEIRLNHQPLDPCTQLPGGCE